MAFNPTGPVKISEMRAEVVRLENDKQNKTDNGLKTNSKQIVGAINEVLEKAPTIATTDKLGVIKVGKNLSITADGTLNAKDVDLTPYQTKTDNTLNTSNKTIVGAINEVLTKAPAVATKEKLGVVKIGANLSITPEGVLSADAQKVDLTSYQTKKDSNLNTTSKEVVGAINEVYFNNAGLRVFQFEVSPQGNLILNYDGENSPNFTLENGNLIYTFNGTSGQKKLDLGKVKGEDGVAGTTDYNKLTNKPDLSIYETKTVVTSKVDAKLDKGAVSAEYNTAKKIEDKIKALENRPQGDFLEKGGYTGTAQDLKTYTDTKVAGLVNSAPATLDTLKELSDALGNDPNFATTVSNKIGTKLEKGTYSGTAQDLKNDIDGKLGKTEKAASAIMADNCSGNSATATKLATARTINGVAFDGASNIVISDDKKLPLSGGTINGNIVMNDTTKISLGTRAILNASNGYGNPVLGFDKAGAGSFGIGAKGSEGMSIRYGAIADVTSNELQWIDTNNEFKHIFDGNLYTNGGNNAVYHTGNFSGLVFKGKATQETVDNINVASGIYDIREIDLIGQGAGVYYTVFSDGNYETGGKSQLAFNYQFGYNKEMFFRTSNASEWEGGWKKVWHSGNFDPNSKLNTSGGTINGNLNGNGTNEITNFAKVYNAVWA